MDTPIVLAPQSRDFRGLVCRTRAHAARLRRLRIWGRRRRRAAPASSTRLGRAQPGAYQAIGRAELGRHLRHRPPAAHRCHRLLNASGKLRRFLPFSLITTSTPLSLSGVSVQTGQLQSAFSSAVLPAALGPTTAVTSGLMGTLSVSGPKQRKPERVTRSRRKERAFDDVDQAVGSGSVPSLRMAR